jgi:nitrite reductase/ring-hydroxylating ferredoxin subunit
MTGLPHVGTYRREIPVGLDRMYENALDWEHLPWLHRTTFSSIECHDAGTWGFRATVGVQPDDRRKTTIELTLDRDCHRWITRTLEGHEAGTEIWTHAFELGERKILVVVDFFVPGVAPEQRERVGEVYRTLYARLYDEDVWMMAERQNQLDHKRAGKREPRPTTDLGPRSAVTTPLEVESGGRRFRIVEVDGELVAHALVCPHMLGPLDAEVVDGHIECPWHGCTYDVRTGRARGSDVYRLERPPRVEVTPDGNVRLQWRSEA